MALKKGHKKERLRGKYEVWRGGEVESVENEWEKFIDTVIECTNDVCGMRRVGSREETGVNDGMKKWVGWWPKEKSF